MELKRVVVTGLGAVTPIGNTKEETWNSLLAGKSGSAPITQFDPSKFKTQFACVNTESPAWAIDRLSILALKIYHMHEQVERKDTTKEHIETCNLKLSILLEQCKDLITAIDQLLNDIAAGQKYMKVYRQMKMYNDPSTNPILYKNK